MSRERQIIGSIKLITQMAFQKNNRIHNSSVEEQDQSSQSFNIINNKFKKQDQREQKGTGYPHKNCYLVEIRQFYRYIQGLKVTNQLERNVQLIGQRLMENFPCAAEKILCEFFKLEMPHIPQSWRLFKNTLIEYLNMEIPENRMRKVKLQIFIKNIKYPHNWKKPRKGRSLSQLQYLETLFVDITEESIPTKETKQEYQDGNNHEEKQQGSTVPTQCPPQGMDNYTSQQVHLLSLWNLISKLNEFQRNCISQYQLEMFAIQNVRAQAMASFKRL